MKNKQNGWLISVALLLGVGLLGATPSLANILNTKHNLSVTGATGNIKATSEKQVCVFCHTPHNAAPSIPLWNHELSSATYTPYSSRSMAAAAPGQPTGTSKLCLSCHDGTVAVGRIHNLPIDAPTSSSVIAGLEAMLTGATSLGTNLRDDHPVSFTYDAALVTKNPELASPATLTGTVRLDGNSQVQCASCHDPHTDANPKFMRLGYKDASGYGSPLCRTCHVKQYWGTVANMSHRESTRMWNGLGTNPWHIPGQNVANDATNSTPKANGCENCHQPHAGTGGELLLKQDGESAVCLVCHNGNVAVSNIQTLLTNYMYKHPIMDATTAGRHTIARQADNKVREDQSNLANRHAECADCHNPHAVSAGTSPDMPNLTNNLASNVLKGIWGVQPTWPGNWGAVTTYTPVQDIQYQYQLCMKCHSYYAFGNTPPVDPYGKIAGGINTDQAQEFNPNNASYHPVVTTGKNPFTMTVGGVLRNYASSLINGNTPTSTMTCADCHSAQPPGVAVPKGPHAAPYWPILYAPWDGTTGRAGTSNHICFQCHQYDVYANTLYTSQPYTTGYSNGAKNLHAYHVGGKNVPCISCHSAVPHGWKRRHLIVFGRTTTSDPGADPAPYNSHSVDKFDGSSDYGIPSNVGSKFGKTLDTITSGNWHQDYCHDGSPPISVGSCG